MKKTNNGLQMYYIECDCTCNDHLIVFSLSNDEFDDGFDDGCDEHVLYVCTQLRRDSFFNRVWLGIKYIFGYQSKYGHWDEARLSGDNVEDLKKLLKDYDELKAKRDAKLKAKRDDKLKAKKDN